VFLIFCFLDICSCFLCCLFLASLKNVWVFAIFLKIIIELISEIIINTKQSIIIFVLFFIFLCWSCSLSIIFWFFFLLINIGKSCIEIIIVKVSEPIFWLIIKWIALFILFLFIIIKIKVPIIVFYRIFLNFLRFITLFILFFLIPSIVYETFSFKEILLTSSSFIIYFLLLVFFVRIITLFILFFV
jgi:hypothetical protein